MAERQCYRDVLPFITLVTMECVNVGLNTLYKAATLKGMNYHVFIVYAYGIAALLLLPAPFISHRSSVLPPLSLSVVCKIVLLGVIGSSSQILGYAGINYSSPTLSSAISNLTPAFTFILAIIFRMERVSLKKSSSQAKVLGTIVSITGAFVVTLYKGPPVTFTSSPSIHQLQHQPLHSSHSSWVLGGIFLTSEYILVPLWYIVQTQIMKEYPAELTVVFFYNLTVSIIAAIVTLLTEGTTSVWFVRPGLGLASIVCSGLFGSCINNTVHTWALHLKGPVFVAMFKPLSIAIAVAMGVMFLGDILHLGSTIGATIISIGFYTVMWGKAKEQLTDNFGDVSPETLPSAEKTPLLKSYKDELV